MESSVLLGWPGTFAYLPARRGIDVQRLELWFENLEQSLGRLFGESDLRLEFDRKVLTFHLNISGQHHDLLGLSHGHAAALGLLAELLMRVQPSNDAIKEESIVLIDERSSSTSKIANLARARISEAEPTAGS